MNFELQNLGLLLAFVWPGLLAVQVYRLIVAGRDVDWGQAVLQGFFFTVINYLIFFPAALYVLHTDNLPGHPYKYWTLLVLVWLVGPLVLPFIWKWLLQRDFVSAYLMPPHETPWDWYFDRRRPVFMLIHL